MAKAIYIVIPVLLLLSFAVAEAAVPRQISLSGVRTNSSSGAEVSATHLNVNFTIFGSQSGGRMLDTREVNITTNANGFWFTNYSSAGFDTEIPMWLAINNTAPRIFLGTDSYSGQYVKRNESNTFNSSNTFVRGQTWLAGQQFADLNVSGDVNITFASGTGRFHVLAADGSRLLGIEDVPNTIHSIFDFNLTNGGREDAFAVRNVLVEVFKISTVGSGIVTIGGTLNVSNITHRSGGLMINNTGGINASAVGFGSIPLGVLGNLFSTANTWTTTQTFNTTGAAPIQWSSNIAGANALGILTFATGSAADPTTIIYAGTDNRLTIGANARTADLILDRSGNFTIAGGNLSLTNALIHGTSGSLINRTGGINASAVGPIGDNGKLPDGALPIYFNGSLTARTAGLIVQVGSTNLVGAANTAAASAVNLNKAFTSNSTYQVTANIEQSATAVLTGSTLNLTVIVAKINGTQFNITALPVGTGGNGNGLEVSWIAIGS